MKSEKLKLILKRDLGFLLFSVCASMGEVTQISQIAQIIFKRTRIARIERMTQDERWNTCG